MRPSGSLAARLRLLAAAWMVGAPKVGNGQVPTAPSAAPRAKECFVEVTGVTVNGVDSHAQSVATPSGQRNVFYGGGFDARCAGTDQRIRSDSAEQYGDEKRLVLIGNVHYTEVRMKLDADRMLYFTAAESLVAEGNVRGITSTGTHFTGPRADYLRPARGIRDRSRLIATSRPNVWLSPKDAGPDAKDSTNIQADIVISDNDSLVYAKGRVNIERPDLSTTSDSAFLDNGKEFAHLVYSPKIVGHGERKFTLEGDTIDLYSKLRKLQRVTSSGRAKATSDDVLLTSDRIDLRITDEKLSRAYAWGPSRARAKSKDQDLTADSIDVQMPGQVLREMHAIRGAMAESQPDTTRIISKDLDRLRGDTIRAYFDSVAAGDTTNKPSLRRITANGSQPPASSRYQVAPTGVGKTDKPNINYVTGRDIIVDFKDHQVDQVTVHGNASGYYAEASPDTSHAKSSADSASKKPSPAGKTKAPTSSRPVPPSPARPDEDEQS